MIATITNWVAQGLVNQSIPANTMNFYRTNFNMPVPNVLDPSGGFVRYLGPANLINESYSYNLSTFRPGFEVCVGLSVWDFDNDGGSDYNLNTQLYNRWTDPSLNTIFWGYNGFTVSTTIPSGFYQSYWYAVNIGCKSTEIGAAGTYHWRASCVGTPTVGTVDTSVVMSNVPNTSTLAPSAIGHIWVEGNNLCYVDATGWKGSISGLDLANPAATPGFIWVDQPVGGIEYISSDGHKRIFPWAIKQFASYFSGGPTNSVNAGTSKAGKIWVDDEFGQTHMSYINPVDGYKYLVGDGNYPY